MPIVLYQLPHSLLGLLICSTWVLVGLGGYLGFHRLCRHRFAESETSLAVALMAVVATVNSLLMAFSAVSVWDSFGAADKAVRGEAVTIGVLARDLAVFGSPEAWHARQLLHKYTQTVLSEEWPSLQRAQPTDAAWQAFDQMFRSVGQITPRSPREQALMPEIWNCANELAKYRRERLFAAEAHVPPTLWIVVVAGTLLTLMTTYVFPPSAFNLSAIGLLSLSMGLVFFFIVALDRPFTGAESIGPEPIASALEKMARWSPDPATAHTAAPPTPQDTP